MTKMAITFFCFGQAWLAYFGPSLEREVCERIFTINLETWSVEKAFLHISWSQRLSNGFVKRCSRAIKETFCWQMVTFGRNLVPPKTQVRKSGRVLVTQVRTAYCAPFIHFFSIPQSSVIQLLFIHNDQVDIIRSRILPNRNFERKGDCEKLCPQRDS